jgi:cobalt/nickel transport protein
MERWAKLTILAIIVLLAIFLPLASEFPDGLERVAEALGVEELPPIWRAPMSDYVIEAIAHGYFSTLIAGIIGIFIVFFTAWIIGKILVRSR